MQKNFTLKRIVCLLASLCLAAGLVGCADMPASSSEESSLPTILVGSDVYPPFNYIGEDGAPPASMWSLPKRHSGAWATAPSLPSSTGI